MDPRCRIYNDKFPLRIEPTLYSVPSIIYVPVNQRSQCGVCIADRDIIEIILRPFRWSNNSCNVFTQERIDARSQPPFSPLNVIINLGSEQCKRFFFFFFSPPLFSTAFLNTPLCRARARKQRCSSAEEHRSRRFSFRDAAVSQPSRVVIGTSVERREKRGCK